VRAQAASTRGLGRLPVRAYHLFDCGFVSFGDNGEVLVSPAASACPS